MNESKTEAITPSYMQGMPINTSLLLTPVLYCFIIAWWNMKLLTDTKWCRKTRNNIIIVIIIIIISWCPQESTKYLFSNQDQRCVLFRPLLWTKHFTNPTTHAMDPWNLLSLLYYVILNDSQDNFLDQAIDLVQFPLCHYKSWCP